MKIHLGDDEIVAAWVAARIPHVDGFQYMRTIGIMSDDGKPIAAVVFHEQRGVDIQVSCASDSKKWLNKAILTALFDYPFNYLKCLRITAMIPSKNKSTCRFIEKLGFKVEGIMRKGYGNDDCMMYGMLRDECKWIDRG